MKRIIFVIAIVLVALCILAAVYYSVPGIPHLFFVYGYGKLAIVNPAVQPFAAKSAHHKYTAAFLGLAALLGFAAYLSRGKKVAVRSA